MKKIFIFVVAIALLVLTGCSGGKLEQDKLSPAYSKSLIEFEDLVKENVDTVSNMFVSMAGDPNIVYNSRFYDRHVSATNEFTKNLRSIKFKAITKADKELDEKRKEYFNTQLETNEAILHYLENNTDSSLDKLDRKTDQLMEAATNFLKTKDKYETQD